MHDLRTPLTLGAGSKAPGTRRAALALMICAATAAAATASAAETSYWADAKRSQVLARIRAETKCHSGSCRNANAVAPKPFSTAVTIVPPLNGMTPTNDTIPATFGSSVTLSADGTTMAVADVSYNGAAEYPYYHSGAVYIYVKAQDEWQMQALLQPTNPRGYDAFGSDVALSADGNTLAIGAKYEGGDDPAEGGSGEGTGSVFIFTRSGGQWLQQGYLQAWNLQDYVSFGSAVELNSAGDLLAVSAPFETVDAGAGAIKDAGAVYVFQRIGNSWSPQGYLRAPAPEANDRFGVGLRLSKNGSTIAILAGEQNEMTELEMTELNPSPSWGNRNNTLYVFARGADKWQLETTIEGAAEEPYFGGDGYAFTDQVEAFDLSGDGNTLAVGSPVAHARDNAPGAVYLYDRSQRGEWSRSRTTLTPSLPTRQFFAMRLTLSADGSTLAATAMLDEGDYGKPFVVVFDRNQDARGSQWSESSKLQSIAWPNADSFGSSLSLSSGGEHLAVGARNYITGIPLDATGTRTYWGAVHVY